MGSTSNRSESKSERMSRLAEIARTGNPSSSNWQTSKGAEIRGRLGVEKGNAFIRDMQKYK